MAALLGVTGSAACIDEAVAPERASEPSAQPRVLGFVKLTFDDIGSPDMSATTLAAPSIAALEAQQEPADDPRRFVFMMMAVDDSDVRITQSLEGQHLRTARLAFRSRANNLNANVVTLLPGGAVPRFPSARTLCTVRTGGPASSPSTFMVNSNWSLQSLNPTTRTVPSNTDFQAVFDEPVERADRQTFSVRGSKEWLGRRIASYRVQSGPATGNFMAVHGGRVLPDGRGGAS